MKSLNIFIFLIYLTFSYCEEDVINENLNTIGTTLTTQKGLKYFAFYGIPYAKPPIGERRFKDPEPAEKWSNTFNAKQFGNVCPQFIAPTSVEAQLLGKTNVSMTEDCLNLNIYTNKLDGKRPVIFYIHGGGYKMGTSIIHDPIYLLDEDVVFVSINYRLGAFGFLSTGTKNAPGNFGFKDQNLALKWVHENIHHFGGDKNAITLMGHSAGAMSVTLHMVSPMSRNLFNRVILMSGAATEHWENNNVYYTNSLAKLVNCNTEDDTKMIECLREKSWEEIIGACQTWEPYGLAKLLWNYEIEKDFGQERFLTDDPTKLFKSGDFHQIPIIATLTKDEFGDLGHKVIEDGKLKEEFNENFANLAPIYYGYQFTDSETSEKITKKLKEFYFNNERIGILNEDKLSNLFSDAVINHGVHRLVNLASNYVNVYYEMLNYKGRYTCSYYSASGTPLYVQHEDILSYVFGYRCTKVFVEKDPEYKVMRRHVEFFTNFVKNGNPNENTNFDEIECIEWKPSRKDDIKTLYINETCETGSEPYQDRFAFWDNLFKLE